MSGYLGQLLKRFKQVKVLRGRVQLRHYLHHRINTENDRPEVLGGDSDLDDLDDCEGERHPPEDSTDRTD